MKWYWLKLEIENDTQRKSVTTSGRVQSPNSNCFTILMGISFLGPEMSKNENEQNSNIFSIEEVYIFGARFLQKSGNKSLTC